MIDSMGILFLSIYQSEAFYLKTWWYACYYEQLPSPSFQGKQGDTGLKGYAGLVGHKVKVVSFTSKIHKYKLPHRGSNTCHAC